LVTLYEEEEISVAIYLPDELIGELKPKYCPKCGGCDFESEYISRVSTDLSLELFFLCHCNNCGWSGVIKEYMDYEIVGNCYVPRGGVP